MLAAEGVAVVGPPAAAGAGAINRAGADATATAGDRGCVVEAERVGHAGALEAIQDERDVRAGRET